MGKFKRLVAVLFCCATLIHSQPAKAFWPVFDFIDTVPIFSQISTVIDSLKNLKEQLVQLKENLKALGDQISSIAAFAKEIGDTISEAAAVIAEGTSFINETLGTNIDVGDKIVGATEGIVRATGDVANVVVDSTKYIADGVNVVDAGIGGISEAEGLGKTVQDGLNKYDEVNNTLKDINAERAKEGDIEKSKKDKFKDFIDDADRITGGKYSNEIGDAKDTIDNVDKVLNKEKCQGEECENRDFYDKTKGVLDDADTITGGRFSDEINDAKGAIDDAEGFLNKNKEPKGGDANKGEGEGDKKDKGNIIDKAKGVVSGVFDSENRGKVDKALGEVNKATGGKFGKQIDDANFILDQGNFVSDKAKENKANKNNLGGKVNPSSLPEPEVVEEEEEEEEVSLEEENLQIEAVKENINTALNESKMLNIQFNDLLDVSINTVQDNSEQNNKAIEMMSYAIKMAENLKEEEKKIFQTEINSIKEKQQAVSVRLIDIIEGVKENYNTEYKNKIEDGYKNYEKIAIAYIRGDATKDELNSLGEKLKKDSASIDVTPDSGVMKAVNNEIRMLQENLIKLHQKVKETELKNMNANS